MPRRTGGRQPSCTRANWIDRIALLILVFLVGLPGLGPSVIAAVMAVFGTSVTTMRIFGDCAVLATTWLLRGTALTAGQTRMAALITTIPYAVMSTRLGGLATNTEILFVPLTTADVWIAITHIDCDDFAKQRRVIIRMGVCIGLSVWFKYVAGLIGCPLFAWLIFRWARNRWQGIGRIMLLALYYALICAAPTILSGLFYAWQGEWKIFWYSNIGFMSYYQSVEYGWPMLVYFRVTNLFSIMPIVTLTGSSAGLLTQPDMQAQRRMLVAVLDWMMTEIWAGIVLRAGMALSAYWLLLPIALLAIVLCNRISNRLLRADWWQASCG